MPAIWGHVIEAPARTCGNAIRKAMAFIAAVSGPRVDDGTFAVRLSSCRGCDRKRDWNGKEFCGACGCGKWRLAELDTKLRFENLECPTGRW